MQVRYRNTLQHLIALQKYVLRNTDTGKKMMLYRFLAVEAIILFITIIFATSHNPFNVFVGFIIVSYLAWVFRERSVLLQFRKDFKREQRKDKEGLFEKDRILNISKEGFSVDMGSQRTEYTWDQIEITGKDKYHVYIILTGVLHYVIPLSAFADENEAVTFLKSIASFRSQP
jgi:hypothetical protein